MKNAIGLVAFVSSFGFAFAADWRIGVALVLWTIAHDVYEEERLLRCTMKQRAA